MSILGMSILGSCKRKTTYLACCGLMILGLLCLSTYSYFNQEELLTDNFPMARWIPIFSILIIYTGFSFGYASLPYIFQVAFDTLILNFLVISKSFSKSGWLTDSDCKPEAIITIVLFCESAQFWHKYKSRK